MISMNELLGGAKLEDQPQDIQANLAVLLERMNRVRGAYGKPMTVTSGLRTMEDHLRIYRGIASKKGVPFNPAAVPMKSKHLSGAAVDIFDPNKELQAWCKANESLLESAGLWMEDFGATPNWCHFQIYPPKSGKRFFLP